MVQIKRKYIDKHWLTYIARGSLAMVMGGIALFGKMEDLSLVISYMSVFLLLMGIIDASSALYGTTKKHGWLNAIFDSLVDIVAAVCLLFTAQADIAINIAIISIYVLLSGIIDIVHSFVSTVDPTDRFIRVLVGACGCIMGFVIFNAGSIDISVFIRFFGSYMLIVAVCSLIYGVDNRKQKFEDRIARKVAANAHRKLTAAKKIRKTK